uniref:Glycosyltransferase n=1 Tax=Phytolacca americana TaxID=3527 RepID=B5MGN8_PHYAM|nr:glucosyltransferase [Phytolacca americana]BAH05015.1 glucosyltransferase [Phytolacca americana]
MRKTELVFVPSPGMGHLLSTVELAKVIVHRDDRISVVILMFNLPFDLPLVNAYVESQSRDSDPSRLTFVSLPTLPNPPDPTSNNFFYTLVDLHKPLVKKAVEDRVGSGSLKPAGFVLDFFCTTLIDVANELHLPSYIYFTSGASLLNMIFHFQSLAHDNGIDIATEFDDPDLELDVPGFRNRVPSKVVPGVFFEKDGGSDMFLNLARRFRQSKGILVNTFIELESYAMQSLLEHDMGKIPAVYPVGPILELDNKSRSSSSKKKEDDQESIIRWLDDQPDFSVVFLCFGSMGSFSEDQVKEIANGLDRAGYRFLWSLRRPAPEGKFGMPSDETFEDALPEGFMGRTAHLGKIIGWAPQVSILAHRAVGGFVSHCGWNSTLESLWFGIPMATWPMYAEQQLNAFELVKEVGLAVEIRMDYRRDRRTKKGNFVITAEEIENGVKKLMSKDEEMSEKVREMSEKGKKALEDGGSSHHWLGRFIEDVLDNVNLNST